MIMNDSRKEVEKILRDWGLLQTQEDIDFYWKIVYMNMNSKLIEFGEPFLKMVMGDIYENFHLLKLRDESGIREKIKEKKDPKQKILLAETYLRMSLGQKKFGLI